MIGFTDWILIIVLTHRDVNSGITNDVFVFESKEVCERTRDEYIKVIAQGWALNKSYVSQCVGDRRK